MSTILTDYYRFQKHSTGKTRYNCTASTKSYPEIEALRNKSGELFLHYLNSDYVEAPQKRRSDKALSKGKHLSSVYFPDVALPFAFGDYRGTADAILIHFVSDGEFELFIARGQKANRNGLYNLLAEGELSGDIEELKKRSVTE